VRLEILLISGEEFAAAEANDANINKKNNRRLIKPHEVGQSY
jgi:hypothetical protein